MAGYPRRVCLINEARDSDNQIKDDPLINECKVFDDRVTDRLQPISETMSVFDGLTFSEAQRFHDVCKRVAAGYLKACKDFEEDQTLAGWKEYCIAYSDLMAIMYLHYWWQIFLKGRSQAAAADLGMSKLHFEQLLTQLQEDEEEEDVIFRRDITELGDKCAIHPISEVDPAAMTRQELLELCMFVPTLTQSIAHMARHYRLENATDIASSLPLDAVLAKVLEAAAEQRRSEAGDASRRRRHTPSPKCSGERARRPGERHADVVVEFFPGKEDLQKWTQLSVAARVQKSNFHHYRVRGQWQIRRGLEIVAHFCNQPVAEVLALPSAAAIGERIQKARRIAAGQDDGDVELQPTRLEDRADCRTS